MGAVTRKLHWFWAVARCQGQYVRDQKNGFGVFTWADGRRYEGYWNKGERVKTRALKIRRL